MRQLKLLKHRPDPAYHGTQLVGLGWFDWRTLVLIERLVAICAPHALELARVRVIHHDAAVPVPVSDEHFIGLGVNTDTRGSLEDFGSVAAGLAALTDGHDKFAVPRELENLIVIRETREIIHFAVCVPQDPH